MKFFDLAYFWSFDFLQLKVAYQAKIDSKSTVYKSFSKFLNLASKIIKIKISKEKSVSLDIFYKLPKKFKKQKLNVEESLKVFWFCIFIDVETSGVVFEKNFKISENFFKSNLNIINNLSKIFTDSCVQYNILASWGFFTGTVNHSSLFINPVTDVNNQIIENTWSVNK